MELLTAMPKKKKKKRHLFLHCRSVFIADQLQEEEAEVIPRPCVLM